MLVCSLNKVVVFLNVCIVPYIKKAQLIRLLCDFFDCFNAELHSFKSSYWVPKWVFILQREIRSFIISLWQLKSQSCYTFAEILQDLIVSLFDRWSVYKCVYDTFTSYHFKPKKEILVGLTFRVSRFYTLSYYMWQWYSSCG